MLRIRYIISDCHLGKNDSLFDIVTELQKETQIPIDASCEEVIGQLQERLRDKQVKSRLGKLTTDGTLLPSVSLDKCYK